ncbi:sensor histidine kinase [Mucilaginibacter conchicola]|uniref:sensor histidine kinase n=1 Tax=Mucilaginibacter conchicola TaxID=2303333 RepID=UPI001314AD17|nr:sensor histidine kinase [Mucilaginibacter conchicola]
MNLNQIKALLYKPWYVVLHLLVLLSFKSSGKEIIFSRLSVNDGLRSNFVNCVWQDAKGFIWVGTESGLQRYDGNKFIQVYKQSTDNSLPGLSVSEMTGDDEHNMWLHMGRQVGKYDLKTNTYTKADLSKVPEGPTILWSNSKGQILLTVQGPQSGVFIYSRRSNAFERWQDIKIPQDWKVLSVFEDTKTGDYWISGENGLGVWNAKDKQFYHEGYNPLNIPVLNFKFGRYILKVFIDSKRRFFIHRWPPVAASDFFVYEPNEKKLTQFGAQPDQPAYADLAHFGEFKNEVWGFGDNVFNIYNSQSHYFEKFYEHTNVGFGIRFTNISQMYEDIDHNLWVATDNGLYSCTIIGDRIKHGSTGQIPHNINFAKHIANNGFIVGTWGGKVFPYKISSKLSITPDTILRDDIYRNKPNIFGFEYTWDMCQHSVTHHIWIGCQAGVVIDYDPQTRRSRFINDTVFRKSTIKQIVEDRQHNLWFGSQSGKIIKWSPDGKFRFITNLNLMVTKMLVDTRGLLWIATNLKGVMVMDPNTGRIIQNYKTGDNPKRCLADNFAPAMAQINDSVFAIAGMDNLDILNRKTGMVKHLTVYNGLPLPTIKTMQADLKGNLWMSNPAGIVKYDVTENTFRSYDQKDGLVTTIDNRTLLERSSRLPDGKMVFAGGNTFVIFEPDALRDVGAPKDVTITDLKLFNRYLPVDSIENSGGLNLTHNQNSITFQFASLSYTQRNKLNYYYMLKGAGDNWVKAESSLTASYASLSPGHYVFMVKCVSPDGIPSKTTTSMKIYIRPAYWQTWWFVVLMFMLAAVPFYIIYKLRINRLLAVQRLREKVARDLHDDMGSTLTSINILSEVANTKINEDNLQVKDYLGRISKNSSQMMDAMDDIVWSINPANDTMPRIVARMREYAATVLEPRDIEYTVVNDERLHGIKLDMDVRRNLFLIYKETLNNLVKYAKAKNVQVAFAVSSNTIQMEITDDGEGFDVDAAINGNGLANMRKRAKAMAGSFTITSEKNVGTIVTLKIPVT